MSDLCRVYVDITDYFCVRERSDRLADRISDAMIGEHNPILLVTNVFGLPIHLAAHRILYVMPETDERELSAFEDRLALEEHANELEFASLHEEGLA